MLAFAGSTTIWLLATNVLLAVAVLVCCALIGWNVLSDLRRRHKESGEEASVPVDYLDSLRDLGVSVSVHKNQIDEMEKA
jgi:hypothetical protein